MSKTATYVQTVQLKSTQRQQQQQQQTGVNTSKRKIHDPFSALTWIGSTLLVTYIMVHTSICVHTHQKYSIGHLTDIDLAPEAVGRSLLRSVTAVNKLSVNEVQDWKTTESLSSDKFFNIDNIELSWRGEVKDADKVKSGWKNIHLVVSHCDKDLGWLDQFTRGRTRGKNRTIKSFTVFSKCGNEVTNTPKYAKIVNLPNVGRCDHTYAHWMANYISDEFDDDDVVYFVKDNPYQTRNGDWRRFNEMLGQSVVNGFSCALRANYGLVGYFDNLDPSLFHFWDLLKTFNYKKTYQRQGGVKYESAGPWGSNMKSQEQNKEVGEQMPKQEPFISQYKNLEEWQNEMGFVTQKPFTPVCYGGVFAAKVRQIRNNKHLWPKIESNLARADNLEEGHFAERSWAGKLFPLTAFIFKL